MSGKKQDRGVLMCGSLWKDKGLKHRNQGGQRFFVLYGPKRPGLSYFMEEKNFKSGMPPKKTYDLEGCSLTCPGRKQKKAEVIGLFHPVRGQLLLKCPCPIQCEWWMEALEGVLTKKEVLARSDFDVIKMVGKGSFGMVLQVRKKDSGSIYALKVLDKKHVESKADSVKATKNERKVLEIVNHPFIVKLHYAFQTNGALCLVMDFVNGGELFAHLKREGMFCESDSCLWSAEILLALEYLHQMGIIYRDLKPENVLLDPHGHVKLTDFGLAREEDDKEGLFAVAGSAYYMAPEIVLMKGHGVQADWWSLGVLIYEMLTGLPPFYEQDARAGYQKLLTRPIEYPGHVSSNARKLINGLLCTDPEKRLGCPKSTVDPSLGAIASFPTEADGLHIKQQVWFRKVDFSKVLMKQLRPRMVPPAKDILDTSNFDEVFTSDETWRYSAFMRDSSVQELLRDEPKKDAFGQDFNFKKKTPFRRPRRFSLPDPTASFDEDNVRAEALSPQPGRNLSPGSSTDSEGEKPNARLSRTGTLAASEIAAGARHVRMPERPLVRLSPWSLQGTETLSVEVFRSRAQNCRSFIAKALEACPLPKEGWLMKRGQTFSKKWRQRWVKLIPSLGCVIYYKDGTQLTPKGVFGLPAPEAITCNEGMYREGGKVYVYSFTVSVDVREFEFICESLTERDEWLSAMRATAARWKQSNNPKMQLCRMTSRQKRGVIRSFLNFGAAAAAQFTLSTDDGRWHGVLGDGSTVDMIGETVTEEGAQPLQKGRYDGMVDRTGFWNGRGMLRSYDGSIRDGFWERGLQGRLVLVVYPNGDFYEGEWHSVARDARQPGERKSKETINTHGHRTGFGIMCRANGDCYEGEWLNGLEHGTGMAYYHLGGEVCVGNYARGVRDGHGVLYYPNGTVYDGGWRSGKQSGLGVMIKPANEDEDEAPIGSPPIAAKGQRRASHESAGDVSFTRVASDSSIVSKNSDGSFSGSYKDSSISSMRSLKKSRSFRCIDGQQIHELEQTLNASSSIRKNPNQDDDKSDEDAIPAIDEGDEPAPAFEDARGISNSSLDGKECLQGTMDEWNSDDEDEGGSRSKRSSIGSAQAMSPEGKPTMWGSDVEAMKGGAKGKAAEGGGAEPDEGKEGRGGAACSGDSAEGAGALAPTPEGVEGAGKSADTPAGSVEASQGDSTLPPPPPPPAEDDDPTQPPLKDAGAAPPRRQSDYCTQSFDMSGEPDEWDADSAGGTPHGGSPIGSPQHRRGSRSKGTSPRDDEDKPMSPIDSVVGARGLSGGGGGSIDIAATIHEHEEEVGKDLAKEAPIKEQETKEVPVKEQDA